MKIVDNIRTIENVNYLFNEPSKYAIYGILNLLNGKIYIGSAVNVDSRLRTHKSRLNLNKHYNKHLQNTYNEYGVFAFEFVILEYVANKIELLEREQIWIDLTDCCNPVCGYNKRKIANSNLGLKKGIISKETRLKLSIANTGFKHSEETKIKLSIAAKGRKLTEAHKEKVRLTSLGRPVSIERKAKIGLANSRPDKRSCPEKSKCKCRECKNKKNLKRRLASYNHEGEYSL